MVPQKQPRFQLSHHCKYKDILGEENRWYFPTLEQKAKNDPGFHKFMDDKVDRMRKDVQEHLFAVLVSAIEIGGIGAVPTADAGAGGYHLLEFTWEPYECQESHQIIVGGKNIWIQWRELPNGTQKMIYLRSIWLITLSMHLDNGSNFRR